MKNKSLNYCPVVCIVLFFAGCSSYYISEPAKICHGANSPTNAMAKLKLNSQKISTLKAIGNCRLQYWENNKKHNENFSVKIWVQPDKKIRLQGDVAFDPKGLVVGSNEKEFWLAMKTAKSYFWGKWSQTYSQELIISPDILLEAIGIINIESAKNYTLTYQANQDILQNNNKKIHIDTCNYRPVKIEYINSEGKIIITAEMDKYKEFTNNFSVPTVIKITNHLNKECKNIVKIILSSVKQQTFTEKQQNLLFERRQPAGFKHIYEIVNGEIIKEK